VVQRSEGSRDSWAQALLLAAIALLLLVAAGGLLLRLSSRVAGHPRGGWAA
jgi:hypothetical protein